MEAPLRCTAIDSLKLAKNYLVNIKDMLLLGKTCGGFLGRERGHLWAYGNCLSSFPWDFHTNFLVLDIFKHFFASRYPSFNTLFAVITYYIHRHMSVYTHIDHMTFNFIFFFLMYERKFAETNNIMSLWVVFGNEIMLYVG